MEGDLGPANAASFQCTKSRHDLSSPQIMSLPISISSGRIVVGLIFELIVFLSWTVTSIVILVWMYFRIEQSFEDRSTPTWIAALPALVFVASGCLFPPFRRFIIPLITPVDDRQKCIVAALENERSIFCWTCYCGRTFFADFAFADAIMTEVNALAQVYENVSLLIPADCRFTTGRRLKVKSSVNSFGTTKSRKSAPPRDAETESNSLRIFLFFRSTAFRTILFHRNVSDIRYDSEMLTRFGELYFHGRSWIQRFFDMKEVKEITVINVSYSVENVFPEAQYHSDRAVYQKWKKTASPGTQLLERFRLHSVPKTLRLPLDNYKLYQFPQFPQVPLGKAQPEQSSPLPRSSMIFGKLPKKVGDMMKPNNGDTYTQEWAILFEEGVRFHRFLFAILLHTSFCGNAFLVWRGYTFGVQNPSTLELVGIGSWFTAVFTLFCTVWYQWAESG